MKTVVPWLAPALLVLHVCAASAQGTTATEENTFDRHVAPILATRCLECHSGREPKGGLSLIDSDGALKGGDSGVAVVPGDPGKSLLWQRVTDDEMPPKHPLSKAEKTTLREWIKNGAAWGTSPIDPFAFTTPTRAGRDWWSLQPLSQPSVPDNRQADWEINEIDAFIMAELKSAGLQPSPRAAPRTLIRRLYFDLIGLPPSPEDVQRFAADPSPKAWRQIVDELLRSQHYGERWGRHWLDVVRFGESDGFERNFPRRTAWYYRDWVINALNKDLAYDDFVRMQLIGDQIKGGIDGAAATGFWVAGVHNTVVGGSRRMKLLARQDEIEEVLATVGQTFLGLTVNCARCHDHRFDPISQKDFYQLASAISGLGYGERVEESPENAARLAAAEHTLAALQKEIAAIDAYARREILAAREKGDVEIPEPPPAFARWEFDSDLRDSIGQLHGEVIGNARIEDGALIVDQQSFVQTAPLQRDIAEKTLEAWVVLDNMEQRGGASISIETRNGVIFDAIVFGEREPQRWMAGSNGFVRTESFQGPAETEAVKRPVHFAIVYTDDGTITGYRDGRKYGKPIRKSPLQKYEAGNTEIVFGLRHKPAGGNKQLEAKILKAAFYDRALTEDEVAASSGNFAEYVSEKQIVKWLDDSARTRRIQLKREIAAATESRDQLKERASQKIYTLTAGGGAKTHVLLRGDPDNVGELVAPRGVEAIPGISADFGLAPDAPEAERRHKLSSWITHTQNPLFARVIVNRVWHYHFGTGLVDTPNDLGFNGGRPSHPKLLDWLAVWFQKNGYSLKKLHTLIVSSATWQQQGFPHPPAGANSRNPADIDADNRLLWKMTPRRLEAESIRDSMLVVAGQLNAIMGGPSFEDVDVIANNGTTYYEPKDVEGPAWYRRTIYRFNPRGGRSALLDTFDCPDPAAAAPRRAVTTTPLQALSLLNNSFVLQMSEAFASRVQEMAGDELDKQVSIAWLLAVAREPTAAEAELSRRLVRDHGLPALGRGLFNANEFVIVE